MKLLQEIAIGDANENVAYKGMRGVFGTTVKIGERKMMNDL